jgi:hypothetical protein
MNTRPTKRELLEAYLGNFEEYIFTGWMFDNNQSDLADINNWNCHWKKPIYPLSDFKINQMPAVIDECHCTTPIVWNCLIKHTPTGRLEFVGSVCMNYFDMNKKRCVQCNVPNLCATRRCKGCRKRCKFHDEYHDDNAVHTRPAPRPRVVPSPTRVHGYDNAFHTRPAPRPSIVVPSPARVERYVNVRPAPKARAVDVVRPFYERPLAFGKYRGRRPNSLIWEGSDGWRYYFWLFECDLLTEVDKTDLSSSLRFMRPLKGKYSSTLSNFEDIKKNDPGYYDWLKRTWTDAFVKYLP